jgi:hypothetical protein
MFKEVLVKRFKRFENERFTLHADGLTICAGPNSSGKSTLLHALAVWAFGVAVVRQFKGDEAVRIGYKGQGAGISAEDFTPINIPDLRHLWLNLKSQIPSEGYSMAITVKWDEKKLPEDTTVERILTMSFSLVQDRLFVKAEDSNLTDESHIPVVVYVPPVAGIDAREEFATLPKRRAMLGRGLAGAILRNYLYDLEAESRQQKDSKLKQTGRKRLTTAELSKFRTSDPWERLNSFARERFSFELRIVPFDPDFHTVLKVLVQPKKVTGGRWQNDDGVARDLMVEGSGAQQWLTVLAFALSPNTNVLLLDEPDAHLFTGLKLDLVQILSGIACDTGGPQVLLATHAIEILKRYPIERIMDFGAEHPKFMKDDIQRSKLISGLGHNYAPLIEKARSSRALLFVENKSDQRILEAIANTCGLNWPSDLAIVANTEQHSDRLKLYRNLLEAIDGLKAVSIRDRDHSLHINEVDETTLRQKNIKTVGFPDFHPLTLRRREIENYALIGSALAEKVGEEETQKWWESRGWAWPHNKDIETHLLDQDIKTQLGALLGSTSTEKFLSELAKEDIHQDLKTVAAAICSLGTSAG